MRFKDGTGGKLSFGVNERGVFDSPYFKRGPQKWGIDFPTQSDKSWRGYYEWFEQSPVSLLGSF